MALRASYYGLKKMILEKVLGDYDAAGVKTNKELTTLLSITQFEDTESGIKGMKFGNVVSISFEQSKAITADANTPFFTLPVEFRPTWANISFTESLGQKRVGIGKNGGVYCSTALSDQVVRGCFTFVTSS